MAKECTGCGKCCIKNDHIDIYDEDLKNWKGTFLDSDAMLCELDYFGSEESLREHIRNEFKRLGIKYEPVDNGCILLTKLSDNIYGCFLHGDKKPKMCRDFKPGSKHAKEFCNCPA